MKIFSTCLISINFTQMITQEHIQSLKNRLDALRGYL